MLLQILPCLHEPTQRAERASGRVRQAERITFNGNLVGEVAGSSRGEHTLYDSVIFIFHSRLVTHYLADRATASR